MFLRLVTGLCLLEIVFGASCDRTFTSFSGTVTSPDYQSSFNYANNLNCQYDIRVSSGNAIRLRWTIFDVKGKMPSCYNDYVEIFIGCNRRSIGRYCSSENSYTTPFDVYSPDNCLRLKFRSDSSGTGLGFRATYSTVSDIFGSCPFSESKYSKSGIINSPRWPRVYTTIGSCYWKIEVGSNKAVKIAFMDFDLDYDFGCDDKVKVKGGNRYDSYDNSSTVKDSMCGFKSPFYLTSTKERIWIRFKSDGSLSNRGFVAGYVTYDLDSPSCDRTFTSSFGTVTSRDYQSSVYYANNMNCQYDIRVSPGSAIRLTWTLFDVKGKMPSCYNDYVEIFIGCNRRSIGRYCSENSYTPFDVYSPDNCLRLKFKSDSSGTGKGFKATYYTVSYIFGTSSLSSSCPSSESKYSNSGVINSPRWPRVYATRGSCYWKIEVGSSKAVKIAFMDFDLDYDFGCDDKVKVKGGRSYDSYDDSSTVKDSMCGFKSPFYFTSTKDRIWIRFKSDGSGSSRGFVAGYVTYNLDSPSSGSTSTSGAPAVVGGIVAAVIVCICIGSIIFYVCVYRKRVAMRQAVPHQAMTTQVNVASQQAVVHPPPPTQPCYGPSPPAGYGPPPPIGYVPPPAGGSAPPFQPDVPPPPYSQVVGAPYPQQDKSGPYPSVGAAPYLPGQAGGPPSYPPGQPGGMAPYPPAQPQGAAPYPPDPSSYPTGPPGAAPYPPK